MSSTLKTFSNFSEKLFRDIRNIPGKIDNLVFKLSGDAEFHRQLSQLVETRCNAQMVLNERVLKLRLSGMYDGPFVS